MENKVSGVSFKANLVTKIKGRHNILEKVGQNFAEKTKNIEGDLFLSRTSKEIVDNAHALTFKVEGSEYIISENYEKLVGENLKNKNDVTNNVVENITNTFVNIFKALRAESEFNEKIAPLEKNIISTKKALKGNQILSDYFRKRGSKYAGMHDQLAKQNQGRLDTLTAKYSAERTIFLNKANEIGKNDPYLDVWHCIMNENSLH